MKIEFANYRAFEKKVFDDKVISSKAKLYICLFDLDDDLEEDKEEKVQVLINGKNAGEDGILGRSRDEVFLKSAISNPDGKWQIYELEFDTKLLKFPKLTKKDNYPEPEINTVELELDMNDKGWALEVDWAVISYDAISPTFLIHGASQDHEFWNGRFYEELIADIDFYYALDDQDFPYYYKIDIKGAPDPIYPERDLKGGALIKEGGDQLKEIIPQLCKMYGVFSFNLVGHSKGGLWARDALAKLFKDPNHKYLSLCHLVTLGTPHKGSVLADYADSLLRESEYQKLVFDQTNKKIGFLQPQGSIPTNYEQMRELYWLEDFYKILGNDEYWNKSYEDLNARFLSIYNESNIPLIKNHKNFDDSKPFFYAVTAYADNNGNDKIDSKSFMYDEWFPLQFSFTIKNSDYETFFNKVYESIGKENQFLSRTGSINPSSGYIQFYDNVKETTFQKNDLFVSVDSGMGFSFMSHIPMKPNGWWNGEEPDATTHGTVCSKEVGEFLLGKNTPGKYYINKLR